MNRVAVEVVTWSIETPEQANSKIINWRDSSDRKWLQNHLHWAMMNGVEVTLAPKSA